MTPRELLAVKNGFILFIKSYHFPLQINTLERERVTVKVLHLLDLGDWNDRLSFSDR